MINPNIYPDMYKIHFYINDDFHSFSIESLGDTYINTLNSMIRSWSSHKILKFSIRQANELEYCLEKVLLVETLRDKVNDLIKEKITNPIVVVHPKKEDGTIIYEHPTNTITDGREIMSTNEISRDYINDQLFGRHYGFNQNLLKGNDVVSILQSNYRKLYNDTFKKDKICVIQEIAKLENKFKYLRQRENFKIDKEILSYIETNIKLLENYLLCRITIGETMGDEKSNSKCSNLKNINVIFKDINSSISRHVNDIENVKESDEYKKCSAIVSDEFVSSVIERLEKMNDAVMKM
jgi:hypothetical protein